VIEPERLAQISLGQENPRMRMNAAPGSRPIRTRTLKGFHNVVLFNPFRAKRIAAEKQNGRTTAIAADEQVAILSERGRSTYLLK